MAKLNETVERLDMVIEGAQWVWPNRLDGIQPGDERLVYAQLEPGALATGAALRVQLSGGLDQVIEVELGSAQGPLLSRAAVGARIQRLNDMRAKAATPKERQHLRHKIVALSRQHRVLSDHTALLVLETEQDYERFKIDRKALTDILTAGAKGVELIHRDDAVLSAQIAKKAQELAHLKKKLAKSRRRRSLVTNPRALRGPMHVRGDPLSPDLGDDDDDDDDDDEAGKEQSSSAACVNCFIRRPQSRQRVVAKPRPASSANPSSSNDGDGSYGYEFADDPLSAGGFGPNDAVVRVRPGPTRSRVSSGFRPRLRSSGEGRSFPSETPAWMVEAVTKASAYRGRMQDVMLQLESGHSERAVVEALAWRNEEPGNVMALVALGEALEARGAPKLAARAYGSIVDLYPSRADMRRFAANRLERLDAEALALAIDIYARALAERPAHLTAPRLHAMALLRAGGAEQAFEVLERGLSRRYPSGRFRTGAKVMREELGIIAAVWLHKHPNKREGVVKRLQARGAKLATKASLRFVLTWETDANDVDLHLFDGHYDHAFYSNPVLSSGGRLYSDVTNGYGPECFAIKDSDPAYPFTIAVHYYSRGPMGYGMGKVAIIAHDGAGEVHFDDRPFVVMRDRAHAVLGSYSGPG